MMVPSEGWGWPLLARKAHYFRDHRSLCGRWWYTGELDDPGPQASPDDCAACQKKLTSSKAGAA
jgi:hypothetical protein